MASLFVFTIFTVWASYKSKWMKKIPDPLTINQPLTEKSFFFCVWSLLTIITFDTFGFFVVLNSKLKLLFFLYSFL